MNYNETKELYKRVNEKNILVQHVCEVGVYLPQTSNIINFIEEGTRSTLVEPDKNNIKAIKNYFGKYNITIHPVAIYDYTGKLELIHYAASTFAAPLKSSPALENEKENLKDKKKIEVEYRTFNEIDDGLIDLLSIDTEGSEWFVLKYMLSRPKVISIETHGKSYLNPFINEINSWMKNNNYEIWYKDLTDTVFIKMGITKLTVIEIIQIYFISFKINWRRIKYRFKRNIFNKNKCNKK